MKSFKPLPHDPKLRFVVHTLKHSTLPVAMRYECIAYTIDYYVNLDLDKAYSEEDKLFACYDALMLAWKRRESNYQQEGKES